MRLEDFAIASAEQSFEHRIMESPQREKLNVHQFNDLENLIEAS